MALIISTVQQVLPADFSEWYPPETLVPNQLTEMGRPRFTQRDLVDWEVNDLRSLLIIENIPRSWNGQIPSLEDPRFEILVLSRQLDDDSIAQALACSNLYMEHDLDIKFRIQTARYTLQATRQRRADPQKLTTLSVAEWRNVIENYLLNIACEAQSRLDYKRACAVMKKKKRQAGNDYVDYEQAQYSNNQSTSPLLRQAIMTSLSTSPNVPAYLRDRLLNSHKKKQSLSLEEKQTLWVQVQTNLYQRLGLDWHPDQFE